jgi:GNAT superfamily N-acetyltransferase
MHIERTGERERDEAEMDALFSEGFPDFITADASVRPVIGRVREYFPHLDIILLDGDPGVPVATGWGVPVAWDGDPATLPPTFGDLLRRAVEGHEDDVRADTFALCGAVVHPGRKGTGVASALVEALVALGPANGLGRVVAPLRPTLKHRYPLTPVEQYASWVRGDGLPLDPWLRLHLRLGGRVLGPAPAAQTMTGTVEQWETWTGLALPGTGDYVIPAGLAPLHVDRDTGTGTYVEPNIWVRHR